MSKSSSKKLTDSFILYIKVTLIEAASARQIEKSLFNQLGGTDPTYNYVK